MLSAATPLLLNTLGCSDGTGAPTRDGSTLNNNTDGSNAAANSATGASATGIGSTGTSGSVNLDAGVVDDEECGSVLPVLFRDFKGSGEAGGHPDFELSARGVVQPDGAIYQGWNDVGCELVETTLGADSKPVAYTGAPNVNEGGPTVRTGVGRQKRVVSGPGCWTAENPTPPGDCNVGTCQPWDFDPPTHEIQSAATFAQWYNTDQSINMEIPLELPLTEDPNRPGTYVYDNAEFFPLDGQGFGNTPGEAHNYHFTTEIHVKWLYEAEQVFSFRGDDDLWIFVNNRLALDVGGAHQALLGTIDFDARANELGITAGQTYQMDVFHAERPTFESKFRIETDSSCFEPVESVT
jgi:fibro-slime domain-containing protein